MDSVANLPAEERRVYFEQASARLGRLSPQLVEKDFWVCWLVRRIFGLAEIGEHLTFKGGTSLSKVFRLIERFSEDVDLSIERAFLGFGGENEPERGGSGKEQQRRIEKLREACRTAVVDRIHPQLHDAIQELLAYSTAWSLSLNASDPDGQTIEFQFPPAVVVGVSPYFSQSVRVELGARSDHFPVSQGTIRPYLSEAIPDACENAETMIRVLDAERTFWEKATILHALYHQPSDKAIPPRQSRHIYDLFQMVDQPAGRNALQQIDLLLRVAQHKCIFFKSAAAKYNEARPGTLRLVPANDRLRELKTDYAAMQPMFFGKCPAFEAMIERLLKLEEAINKSAA